MDNAPTFKVLKNQTEQRIGHQYDPVQTPKICQNWELGAKVVL